MTATQVFKRFLKDNGLYTSYMPRLKSAYDNAKECTFKYNGEDYWEKQIYQPLIGNEKTEKDIMLDAMLKLTGYRFIDAIWAISIYSDRSVYALNEELSKSLYKYAIKNLKRYQLTAFRVQNKKNIRFEYK